MMDEYDSAEQSAINPVLDEYYSAHQESIPVHI